MKNALDLITVGGECLGALAEIGVTVEMITDFAYAKELTEDMGKPGLTPKLSSDYNDFTEESGFWLFMREDGEYSASVATRYDNVGREKMNEYMIRTMNRHYPHQRSDTLLHFTDALPPNFHGRMAYIGELFMRPGFRGSKQKLRYFMMLLQTTIATKWTIDWTYAVMRDRDVKLGFATNYGFTIQIPGVSRWAQPAPQGRGDAEWLVAVSADTLSHMMGYYAQSLESL